MFKIKFNPLFLIIALIFCFTGMFSEMLLVFFLVLIHEITHAVMAVFLGYDILGIEIFPFGGVAEYSGFLEMKPQDELKVALAGPAINLLLALLFWWTGWEQFLFYNFLLALFNLIPILPLDGGRVLRALLVKYQGFKKGTKLAVKIAQFGAVIGFIIGLQAVIKNQVNVLVLLLAFFVYGAAFKEKKQIIYSLVSYLTDRRKYLEDNQVKKIMLRTVGNNILVNELIAHFVPGRFNIFFVFNQQLEFQGMLTEVVLLEAYFSCQGKNISLAELLKE